MRPQHHLTATVLISSWLRFDCWFQVSMAVHIVTQEIRILERNEILSETEKLNWLNIAHPLPESLVKLCIDIPPHLSRNSKILRRHTLWIIRGHFHSEILPCPVRIWGNLIPSASRSAPLWSLWVPWSDLCNSVWPADLRFFHQAKCVTNIWKTNNNPPTDGTNHPVNCPKTIWCQCCSYLQKFDIFDVAFQIIVSVGT